MTHPYRTELTVAAMKFLVFSTTVFLLALATNPLHAQQARRTAPRRTTANGGTYGTETYATVTQGSTIPTQAPPAEVTAAVPVFQPLNAPPSFVVPGGVAPLAVGVQALLPSVVISATQRTRPPGVTVPTRVMPTRPPSQEDGSDVPGDEANKAHIPTVGLCEEVEEVLKPGMTEQECFVAEPVTLRYWQPYRALRTIKCKNG